MDKPGEGQPPIKEKRRGSRFPVVVFVEVKWQGLSGEIIKETAQAMEVSALGGLLDMKAFPGVGSEIELTNLLSKHATQARVVGTRLPGEGGALRVAVELVTQSDAFWGLNLQLRKNSAELVRLEQAIKTGRIGTGMLEESRVAAN